MSLLLDGDADIRRDAWGVASRRLVSLVLSVGWEGVVEAGVEALRPADADTTSRALGVLRFALEEHGGAPACTDVRVVEAMVSAVRLAMACGAIASACETICRHPGLLREDAAGRLLELVQEGRWEEHLWALVALWVGIEAQIANEGTYRRKDELEEVVDLLLEAVEDGGGEGIWPILGSDWTPALSAYHRALTWRE